MSNDDKKDRITLKGYFKKNLAPSESNFAALIDGMLNQQDDGLFKTPGNPLSIKAVGNANDPQTLLNFFDSADLTNPAFKLQLNPTAVAPATAVKGLSISDGQGVSRLFISASSGNVGIGTSNPIAKLEVKGVANIHDGTPVAVPANHMASGSLTIGDIMKDFGGRSGWNSNTAGLLLETLNNTEIAVHDSNTRVASLMYYEGGATNRITIGRNMGWDAAISEIVMDGPLKLTSVAGENADAGKITYTGGATGNALSIYGAGQAATNRKIKLYDDVEVAGKLNVKGDIIAHKISLALNNDNGKRGVLFLATLGDFNHALYNNSSNIDGEEIWDGAKWNAYRLNIRVGEKNETTGRKSALFIESDGNVGIGTIIPKSKLSVAGGLVVGSAYAPANAAPVDGLLVQGNVGIGTTDPKVKLEVNGEFIRKVSMATGKGPEHTDNTKFITGRVITFTKNHTETSLRILYCDNFRVMGNGVNGVAARWQIYIQFNGSGEFEPLDIFQDAYCQSGNNHFPATILGYARNITSGTHIIKVKVIAVPNRSDIPLGNADTGFSSSVWTLEVQEVWL